MLNKKEISRILVITLSNTGDAVLTTPVLDAVSKEFPHARIDMFLSPGIKAIFEKDPRISKIFIYDKHGGPFEKYRLIKKLNNLKYHLVVDLKNTMIPILLRVPYRTSVFRRAGKSLHKRDEHLLRVKEVGISIDGASLEIKIDKKDMENALSFIRGYSGEGKYIIVSAGAKSHVKRWPAGYFAELCDRIVKELNYGVVLVGEDQGTGNPDSDRVVVNEILSAGKENVLDLVGKTNIRELSHLIEKAALLVTNDSAPLHIASAVDTPTVAIFGPTDERKYGPLAKRSVVIRRHLKCAPCQRAQCLYNYECLKEITVDEVFKAVRELVRSN